MVDPASPSEASPADPFETVAQAIDEASTRLGLRGPRRLILAVSGGADSMALLHGCARLAALREWHLTVAHLDHGLRPDSGQDAAFVRHVAEELGLPFELRRTDVAALAATSHEGIEAAGRRARYAFLDELVRAAGPGALAMTAHTVDDQAETVLFHLARGAGAAGLSGIAERRGHLVRPLLRTRRDTLRAALDEAGIAYRLDPSNAERRYARNRARHDLLPGLERIHPGASAALARAAELAAEDEALLTGVAAADLAARRAADGWIDWRMAPRFPIAARILRLAAGTPAPSAERVKALLASLEAERGGASIDLGAGRRAHIRRHRVRILQRTEPPAEA